MQSALPQPGAVVWIRGRRWRVTSARGNRDVARLDVTGATCRGSRFTPLFLRAELLENVHAEVRKNVNGSPSMSNESDIEKNEFDAVEDIVRKHTVGIVTGSNEYLWRGLGSGVLIAWKNHRVIATAEHILGNSRAEDLRFFLAQDHPPETTSREELRSRRAMPPSRVGGVEDLGVDIAHRDPDLDLALLAFGSLPASNHGAVLFELDERDHVVRTDDSTLGYGFPLELARLTSAATKMVFTQSDWNLVQPNPVGWNEFDPGLHFATGYTPAPDGLAEPLGLSGSGRWRAQKAARSGIWRFSVALLGITLGFKPQRKQLKILRVEQLVQRLHEVLG
jgi:hypothetical protein